MGVFHEIPPSILQCVPGDTRLFPPAGSPDKRHRRLGTEASEEESAAGLSIGKGHADGTLFGGNDIDRRNRPRGSQKHPADVHRLLFDIFNL